MIPVVARSVVGMHLDTVQVVHHMAARKYENIQKSSDTWPLSRWPPGKNQGDTRLLSQSQDSSPVLSGTSIWAQYGMLERQPW